MIIQDIIFSIGNIVLSVGLVPSIVSKKDKPSIYTSLITSITMISFTICFITMKLYLSAFFVGLSFLGWLILLIQKMIWR